MPTERELIDQIQALKAQIDTGLRDLIKIQDEAGRMEAKNAAFLTRAELNVWHGKATERLFQHYPGFASDVVAQGPR
jgi:hypothetical protein